MLYRAVLSILAVTDPSIGMTALFLAVQEKDDEIVDMLRQVNITTSPLHSLYSFLDFFVTFSPLYARQYLLQAGADVNIFADTRHTTCLFFTSHRGMTKMVNTRTIHGHDSDFKT